MAIIRVNAVLKHTSGLAKHNVVNSFHFEGDADDAAKRTQILDAISAMYRTDAPGTGSTAAIARYLSDQYPTLDLFMYEVPGTLTDGKETPAGPPIASQLGSAGNLTTVGKLDANNLPPEVACCMSYQGTPTGGVVQARRRGRVYFGPFNNAAVNGANVDPRPSLGLRTTITESFQQMLTATDTAAEFVVYSRPYAGRDAIPREGRATLPAIAARPGTTVGVDQIWIDDEFDTQRRRGLVRTGRTLLAAAG